MTESTMDRQSGTGWRIARWSVGAALLMIPAVAMRLGDDVNWTALDFITMGGMIALALGAYEVLAMAAGNGAYKVAAALAILGAFLLVWINLAVGIIGDEGNPANLMFLGVIALLLIGAAATKLRAPGMAKTLFAMAGAQVLIAGVAVIGKLGVDGPVWPRDVIGVTAILCGIWLLSGALFRYSAR